MPSINNFLKGFQDGLPGMKDYRHASRLYIDDNFKLLPKQKFLFHVVFNLDDTIAVDKFAPNERLELNMLVKACELPKYGFNVEEKIQYNKKMYAATRIQYDPVNITFHDDHADTVNAFWKKYVLMIFRLTFRPHQEVYSYAIRSSLWSAVILKQKLENLTS